MNDPQAEAIAAAQAEVKRLRKQVSFYRGKSTAELNKRWRAMYAKATRPDSAEAFLACDTALNNFLVMSSNYTGIGDECAVNLKVAEQALAALSGTPQQ